MHRNGLWFKPSDFPSILNVFLLAGSSSWANLAPALSQMARDADGPKISGLVLTVPIVCHRRHFREDVYELDSYEQNYHGWDAERGSLVG